jgi:hypothetical protein
MMNNDDAETKKMEEAERKRLEAYEAKKNIERNRKKARIKAHEKLVCRNIAKSYLRDVKPNGFVYLKDISFFRDNFREVTMYQDVMPWIMQKAETFLNQLDNLEMYPTTVIAKHLDDTAVTHMQTVNERIQKQEMIKQQKARIEEEKQAAKLKR